MPDVWSHQPICAAFIHLQNNLAKTQCNLSFFFYLLSKRFWPCTYCALFSSNQHLLVTAEVSYIFTITQLFYLPMDFAKEHYLDHSLPLEGCSPFALTWPVSMHTISFNVTALISSLYERKTSLSNTAACLTAREPNVNQLWQNTTFPLAIAFWSTFN